MEDGVGQKEGAFYQARGIFHIFLGGVASIAKCGPVDVGAKAVAGVGHLHQGNVEVDPHDVGGQQPSEHEEAQLKMKSMLYE